MIPSERIRTFSRLYRVEILLFFAFWISFSYFFHLKPGWNANTRLALTYALVDRRTFAIDGYPEDPLTETEDVAYFNGHLYCDKSPALSFLAAPFYALSKPLFHSLPRAQRYVHQRQWCILWTVSLLGGLAAALFYRLTRLFGANGEEALALTFFLFYGTSLGGYASLFFPYLPATACLIGSYVLMLGPRVRGEEIGPPRATLIGLLISMAGYFEFIFGLAGAVLMLLALWTMKPRRRFVWTILGALPPVIALFAVNYAIFGEITLAYAHEREATFSEGMSKGFMGITTPNLSVFFYITIHPFKGIFFYSPILLCFFPGAFWTDRLDGRAKDLAASWTILIGYLAFASSYYMWWGGWAMGVRNLIPMLPFLFMPILAAMRRHPIMSRAVMLAGAISFLLNLAPIAVDPQMMPGYPVHELLEPSFPPRNLASYWLMQAIPAFLHGRIAMTPFPYLPGALPLLPLAVFWIFVLYAAWRGGMEWDKQFREAR